MLRRQEKFLSYCFKSWLIIPLKIGTLSKYQSTKDNTLSKNYFIFLSTMYPVSPFQLNYHHPHRSPVGIFKILLDFIFFQFFENMIKATDLSVPQKNVHNCKNGQCLD